MRKLKLNKRNGIILHIMIILAVIGISPFAVGVATTNGVAAAPATIPVNMVSYGWMDYSTEQAILNAHPEFLIGNSAAGPYRGNANISKLQAAGIKYFEYIDAGYAGYNAYAPDLGLNLSYIRAAAQAGANGIFVDQVCDGIYTIPDYYYLGQIASTAHSLGLKVVFNTGTQNWADALMSYCDYIGSSETWQGGALSSSQSKWASRTWLLTYNVYDAGTAAALTNSALSQGIRAHYACTSYMAPPSWLGTYVSQIGSYASPVSSYTTVSASAPVALSSTGETSVAFNSNPTGTEVWLDYSYKGVTPLTIDVAEGSHHIGFFRYGYTTLESDFLADNTAFTVTGDLLSGQIASTGTETVSSTNTSVSFTSNPSGVEVWLDYSYKGVTPLTIDVAAGSHHMGFYKYGYNYNLSNDADFYFSAQQTLNIYGDMLAGYTSVS